MRLFFEDALDGQGGASDPPAPPVLLAEPAYVPPRPYFPDAPIAAGGGILRFVGIGPVYAPPTLTVPPPVAYVPSAVPYQAAAPAAASGVSLGCAGCGAPSVPAQPPGGSANLILAPAAPTGGALPAPAQAGLSLWWLLLALAAAVMLTRIVH